MPLSAKSVSEAILNLNNPDIGEAISNLKLQKLLYYAQGFNLASFNKPLFKEKIVAWQYGPVVTEIYNQHKSSGSLGIIPDKKISNIKNLFENKKQYDLFREVIEIYGQFSALQLMRMTHSEMPWRSTKMNDEISHKKMREFFLTRIEL